MTILAFPAALPAPNSLQIGLRSNTMSGGASPFDGTEQTLALPGDRWAASLRFTNLTEAQHRLLAGFVARLRGKAGRFTWSPPFRRRGTATSAGGAGPRVYAASTGGVLLTTGWTGTVAFEAGDYFGLLDPTGRPQLFMANDISYVVSGLANLYVAPTIRRSPNVNEPLILTNPTAVWKLAADEVMGDFAPGPFGQPIADFVLNIEETIW